MIWIRGFHGVFGVGIHSDGLWLVVQVLTVQSGLEVSWLDWLVWLMVGVGRVEADCLLIMLAPCVLLRGLQGIC